MSEWVRGKTPDCQESPDPTGDVQGRFGCREVNVGKRVGVSPELKCRRVPLGPEYSFHINQSRGGGKRYVSPHRTPDTPRTQEGHERSVAGVVTSVVTPPVVKGSGDSQSSRLEPEHRPRPRSPPGTRWGDVVEQLSPRYEVYV